MDMPVASSPSQPTRRAASEVLTELAEAFPNETISVGELVDRLDSRAHGVLLLILALPMCIPNIPGISTIFGVLMIAPALGLLFGQRRLWLPKRVRGWTFPRDGFSRALKVAIGGLERVEFLIKPRLSFLTRWPTVTLTALALMQRDGLLMLLSVPCAIGSIVWVYLFTKYGVLAAQWLTTWVQHLF